MKIAFINVYQDSVERGAEIFVSELSKRLKRNHQVDIYSSKTAYPARWPVLWKLFIDPQGLLIGLYTFKLLPELWKQKHDVIIPTNGGWQVAIVRIFTWVRGARIIVSGQSGKGWDDKNNLWAFPDTFVALTKESTKWASKFNPFVKVTTIPNGVDLDKFNNKKADIFKDLEKPIILTVGALTKDKRQQLAIKAVSKLKKGSLVIIGKGGQQKYLNTLGGKLLGKRFLVAEFPHSKMPEVYQSADLFTYPTSPNESFGIVLLEAMASGLPVVATDDPMRREIIDTAGVFVDPKNTDKYADTLSNALSKDWGRLPIKQAQNYDWGKIALQYEELFNNLIND